jgi:hypothetical protein
MVPRLKLIISGQTEYQGPLYLVVCGQMIEKPAGRSLASSVVKYVFH